MLYVGRIGVQLVYTEMALVLHKSSATMAEGDQHLIFVVK